MIKWDIRFQTDQPCFMGVLWIFGDGIMVYMKFVVFPFGFSSAPYCFCKAGTPLNSKWRTESKRAGMYLDNVFVMYVFI